ncbi:hypothetical protein [Blastococcus sp. VKM Ac-2987]|uniref:hypothetical protein n=1 Tax=Blastococcus sp. VKM Ac-2987 TaxID=3004141 RepID=UPI0022AB5DAB|nr:hypothetical protein [Blastococcus sp. VKM Ac-2987]MCZ2860237.1 hypothetical protein [Blastococcus sp. VKM Ac-2987]
MSALTPDCDPDLSNCGSPVGSGTGSIRSNIVVLALLAASFSVASGEASGTVAFMSGGVAIASALVLGRRCLRLGQRLASSAGAHAPWALHRSRPAG